jgi:peptidoglycan/LPS O-acetylase OafA/YrhL
LKEFKSYLPELDGLRFFAFHLVFLHHLDKNKMPVFLQVYPVGAGVA